MLAPLAPGGKRVVSGSEPVLYQVCEPRTRVFDEYGVRYCSTMRPHQGLAQRIPISTPRRIRAEARKVIAMLVLGGLHNDCRVAAGGRRICATTVLCWGQNDLGQLEVPEDLR